MADVDAAARRTIKTLDTMLEAVDRLERVESMIAELETINHWDELPEETRIGSILNIRRVRILNRARILARELAEVDTQLNRLNRRSVTGRG